jgi:hypothetical protein
MQKVDWSVVNDVVLVAFAHGIISDKKFYSQFKSTEHGGMIRNLLREKGVDNARKLALRALQRRKKSNSYAVSFNGQVEKNCQA